MKIEELKREVDKDLTITLDDITGAAAENCILHNKYLQRLTDQKLLLKKLNIEMRRITKRRYRYYMGYEEECPDEVLDSRGVKIHLDGDDEILEQLKKISLTEEKIRFLENTLSSIVARGFNIKNIIEQRKIDLGIV